MATLGYTGIGSALFNIFADSEGTAGELVEATENGTITKLTAYIETVNVSTTARFKAVIFDGSLGFFSDASLLAEGTEVTVAGGELGQWIDLPISYSKTAGSRYILAVVGKGDNTGDWSRIAVTPIITTGKTTNGTSSTSTSTSRKTVSTFTPATTHVVTNLRARCWVSSGSALARAVIFSDNAGQPNALLARSDEITVSNTAEAENIFSFTGANRITLTSGTPVWIGVHARDPGTPNFLISRDNTSGVSRFNTDNYDDGTTDPFGTVTNSNGPFDFYTQGFVSVGLGHGGDELSGVYSPVNNPTFFALNTIGQMSIYATYTPSSGSTQQTKLSGTFATKPTLVKLSGTFVEKPTKVKVGGTFI